MISADVGFLRGGQVRGKGTGKEREKLRDLQENVYGRYESHRKWKEMKMRC